MDKYTNISVFGVKQDTGEYKLVYRNTYLAAWLKTGKENAKKHGYDNFRFFYNGDLANHYTVQEIFIQ